MYSNVVIQKYSVTYAIKAMTERSEQTSSSSPSVYQLSSAKICLQFD